MPNPIDFTLYLITDRHQVPVGRTLCRDGRVRFAGRCARRATAGKGSSCR
ncbi:MAG: hypothetical protein MZV49_14880 [Rhodopseudomonas palustris]|nr:hypothetical protein [Rhodopseudomonas palustris]